MVAEINSANFIQPETSYFNQKGLTINKENAMDNPIFQQFQTFEKEDVTLSNISKNSSVLREKFKAINDKQGVMGKTFDYFENLLGTKNSSDNVQKIIEEYESGNISYESADKKLDQYKEHQKKFLNAAANVIAAGAAAIGVIGGGLGIGAGAIVGACFKAGAKSFERATNNTKGDTFDTKEITKDLITGGIDGAITVATAGMYKTEVAMGQTIGKSVQIGALSGAKQGAVTGAVIGAGNYATEAAFEDDVDFTLGDLTKITVESAVLGSAAGAVMGGFANGAAQKAFNLKQVNSNTVNYTALSERVGSKKATEKDICEVFDLMVKNEKDPAIQTAYANFRSNPTKKTLKAMTTKLHKAHHPDLHPDSKQEELITATYNNIFKFFKDVIADGRTINFS